MKRFHSLLLAAAFSIGSLLSAEPTLAQAPKQKVSLAVSADSLQFSLMYAAIDGGGFAAEGLEPDLIYFDSGTRQSAAIMSGSAQFGTFGFIQALKASAMGGSLVAFSRMLDVMDFYLVLSNDAVKKSGITMDMTSDEKVNRLKGLRIGITGPGSSVDTGTRAMFKARGLDPDKEVQLQPLGTPANMIAALEKGATDGFVYPAPWPSIAAAKGLGKVVIDPFTDRFPETDGTLYVVVVTSAALLEKNPELVHKVARAFTRGMKLVQENPELVKSYVAKHLPELDQKLLADLWPNYRKSVASSPLIDEAQFAATQKWLNLTSSPPLNVRYERVVSADAAKKAAAELLRK